MNKKKKNKIKDFIREDKKGIYIAFGVIGGLVLCFFGVKLYLKRPSINRFLKSSTVVRKNKREEIHNEYLNYTKNDSYREDLSKIRSILDNEIRKREQNGKIPLPPSYPREHGHGLYKPD